VLSGGGAAVAAARHPGRAATMQHEKQPPKAVRQEPDTQEDGNWLKKALTFARKALTIFRKALTILRKSVLFKATQVGLRTRVPKSNAQRYE